MVRCKLCDNPHDSSDLLWFLPARLTPYVLNNYTTKSPPCHVTEDDVTVPIELLEVEKITSHRSVRGRAGVIAVLYETHRKGLLQPSWEREMDLQHSRQHVLQYSAGTPNQLEHEIRLRRRMRVCSSHRELPRDQGARFLCPGYSQ